jgi:Tfp pilus assembly protein PilF
MTVSSRWFGPSVAGCAALAAHLAGCGPSQADLKAQREKADYHYQLAYGFYFEKPGQGGNPDAALVETLRALEADEKHAEAHFLAGLIFMGREQHLDAERHYRRAIEIKPDFYFARNNLGATYLAMGRWDEAIALFDALVLTPFYTTPGNGHNNLGWAYYQKGNREKARHHLTVATQVAPTLCPAYNNLGMLLLDEKQDERAEKALNEAVKRCPGYAEPYFHLGRLHARRTDDKLSQQSFRRCLELAEGTPLGDRCSRALSATASGEVNP